MNLKITDIQSDIVAILNELDELPEGAEIPEGLTAAITAVAGSVEDKVAAIYHVILSKQAEVEAAEKVMETAKRYINKQKAGAEWLKRQTMSMMGLMGIKKIDRPDCSVTMIWGRKSIKIVPEKLPAALVTKVQIEELKYDRKAVEAVAKAELAAADEEIKSMRELGMELSPADVQAILDKHTVSGTSWSVGDPYLRYGGQKSKEE